MSEIIPIDIKKLIRTINIYRKAYINWYEVLINLAIFGRAKAKLRNGIIIEGTRIPLRVLARFLVFASNSVSSKQLAKIILKLKSNDTKITKILEHLVLYHDKITEISDDLNTAIINFNGKPVKLYHWYESDIFSEQYIYETKCQG
ncbi:hypothetical protein [Caldisphaera sp.]|uniref:hypothetical protein n=1 Tax=Caldisphaera sp. TaxID=2060322 RepID=UPI0025C40057|nr:hypothetical protein [Caldisphaera sp.]